MLLPVPLPLVFLLVFVVSSQGYVWESHKPLRDYNLRYQKVHPVNEVAVKLAKYFLVQGEAIKSPSKRPKRQVDNRRRLSFYDVLFIIDSSGSIRRREFRQGISALIDLIPKARPSTNYASVTFSTEASIDFLFTPWKQAIKNLRNVEYRPGKTNTQAALGLARRQVFNYTASSGLRVGSYKRVLILTDGQSNVEKRMTLYKAFRLKDLGIEVFVVAVGKYMAGISEIVGLASSTDAHLYRVESLNTFVEVVKLIPNWRQLRMQQHKTWLSQMALQEHDYYYGQ